MSKVLIIGQAPPAVKQTTPYDTTLLYEMFSWVGVNKDQAQEIFDFDAMTNKFPGHGTNGHLKPSKIEMKRHFINILKGKIKSASHVLILGSVAKEALIEFGIYQLKDKAKVTCICHPSKRNYALIMDNKSTITESLKNILQSR